MSATVDTQNLLKYRAFLSYAHADMRWGKWLHAQLEGFSIERDLAGRETPRGKVPRSLRPIFRDRDDFSAGNTLADATIAALDQSAALIVICSTVSATRPAVNEEVRLFRSRHPERPVIPVIIDGSHPENFPPALRFEIGTDGQLTDVTCSFLGPDLRDDRDGRHLGLAKIVAGLTGVGTDEIVRRAARAARRRLQKWIAGLSTVAACLAGLAGWAVHERRIAEHNLAIAKQAASSIVRDVAGKLDDVEGMRTESVRTILGTAENAFNKLIEQLSEDLDLRYEQSRMYDAIATAYGKQGDTKAQQTAAEKSVEIMKRLVQRGPTNHLWASGLADSQKRLADVVKARGDKQGALDGYRSALRSLEVHAKAQPDNLFIQSRIASLYGDIGYTHFEIGDFEGAVDNLREGMKRHEQLAQQEATDIGHQQRMAIESGKLGEALNELGRLKEALVAFETSLDIQQRLVAQRPEDSLYRRGTAVDHIHIGDILKKLEEPEAASKHFEAARDTLAGLVKSDPEQMNWQRDLSIALEYYGRNRLALGDTAGALKAYERRHEIALALFAQDPQKVEWRLDLAVSSGHLADLLAEVDRVDDALQHRRRGVALLEELEKLDPGNTRALQHLPVQLRGLGDLLLKKDETREAQRVIEQSLRRNQALVKLQPKNTRWLQDLSLSHDDIAKILAIQGNVKEALVHYRESLAIGERLAALDPDNREWQRDVAVTHWTIGQLHAEKGDLSDALTAFLKAREVIVAMRNKQADSPNANRDLEWLDEQIANIKSKQAGLR